MWPFDRKEKALTAEPAVLQALNNGWTAYPVLGGGQRQRITDAYNVAKSASYPWLYSNSPSLRQVIDCIVRNVGQLEMRLYEEKSQANRVPKPDHPAAMSARYPSEQVSADKYIRQMVKDFLIYDDATAIMAEAPDRRLSFNWIPFSSMEVRGTGIFIADEYRYWRADGTYQDFPADNVFHWHGENPLDPRIGLSHLDTLRDVIAEEVALRQAIIELGNAGLTEAVWAYRPVEAPGMGKPAQDAFEDDLTAKVRRKNRRVIVTQEGTELRSFGVSPKDAQMIELRHAILEQVSGEYGMPLGMLAEEPTEGAREVFINDCLQPLCENYTKFMNQRVLVRVYNWTDGCFSFDLDEKRMGNEWIKTLISAAGAPIFLRDESRARLGMPPFPKGVGNTPVIPTNVQADDGTSTGKPSVDVMPIQDPNKPPQDGSYREAMVDLTEALRKQTEQSEALHATAPVEPIEYTSDLHAIQGAVPDRPLPAVDDPAEAVLHRTFTRYERSYAKHERIDERRFTRELFKDLAEACPEVDVRALAAMVDGIYKALVTSLAAEQADVVFGAAQRNAGSIAARLRGMVTDEPPKLSAKELQELGVPDEVVWRAAQFTEEEIEDMAATKYARELLEASRGSHPSGA